MKKIAILDDHSLFASGLQLILKNAEGVRADIYTQVDALLHAVATAEPLSKAYDLVLLDYYLPFQSFVENILKIKQAFHDTPVIVISASLSPEDKNTALKHGAALFLHKHIDPEQLLGHIQQCLGEGVVASDEGAPLLIRDCDFQLTERQIEILTLVCKGYSNKAIARELQVSAETVKSHLKNIFQRIDVNNRIEAIEKFRAYGFL